MGDALSHAVVPGVALAYHRGAAFRSAHSSRASSRRLGMGFIKAKTRLREDAVIGVVFTSLLRARPAADLALPEQLDLRTIIFGNILGISDRDILQVVIISAVTLLILG